MNYEMFLVSGIRGQHAHGAEPGAAVVAGFGQGAKVIVVAALIMIGVFGNAAINGGTLNRADCVLGLAVGIIVDAFLVRLTLVPALLTIFGHATWWYPRWLDRMTPTVDVEGTSLEPSVQTQLVPANESTGHIGALPMIDIVPERHLLIEPFETGMLETGDGNLLYGEACGNPARKTRLGRTRRISNPNQASPACGRDRRILAVVATGGL